TGPRRVSPAAMVKPPRCSVSLPIETDLGRAVSCATAGTTLADSTTGALRESCAWANKAEGAAQNTAAAKVTIPRMLRPPAAGSVRYAAKAEGGPGNSDQQHRSTYGDRDRTV